MGLEDYVPDDWPGVLSHLIAFFVLCLLVDFFWERIHMSFLYSSSGRSGWIRSRLNNLRDRFSRTNPDDFVTVSISTYNVASNVPVCPASLRLLCQMNMFPDVVILGFQETEMSVRGLVLGNSEKHRQWKTQIELLFQEIGFDLVVNQACGTAMLAIGLRPQLTSVVREVKVCSQKTGLGFLLGNKASIAARFLIGETSLCFVNSHLKDGRGSCDLSRRNASYRRLSKLLNFDGQFSLFSHDCLFWFGDLNYRMNLSRKDILERAFRSSDFDIGEYDQLNLSQNQKRGVGAFQGFAEDRVAFPPTYKLDAERMESRSPKYVKNRVPAFTDRILWRSEVESSGSEQAVEEWMSGVQVLRYDAETKIRPTTKADLRESLISDHLPVVGLFRVMVRKIDPLKRSQVLEQVEGEYELLTGNGTNRRD